MRRWWGRLSRSRAVLVGAKPGQIQENTNRDIFEQLKGGNLMVLIVVAGVVALCLAMKIAHVIFRLVFG